MPSGRGVGLALVLGAVAVGVWLTLSAMTGWALLLMAMVVGGFVGCGMGIGNAGRGGQGAGVAAGVIALGAAVTGRFYALQLAAMADARREAALVGQQAAIVSLANEIARKRGEATAPVLGGSASDFREHTWQKAEAQWGSMSYDEQEQYQAGVRAQVTGGVEKFDFGAGLVPSLVTLRLFDFVCLGLAASTAFKTGSRDLSAAIAAGKAKPGAPTEPGKAVILEQETTGPAGGLFGTLGRVEQARKEAESRPGTKAA